VRLLIDSHTFVWWSDASPALGSAASAAIADPANEVLISVAALWELTIKVSSRKLSLPADLETLAASEGFAVLPIAFPHLRRLAELPRFHRDPFDRMMIAQALAERIPIATADKVFAAYGVQIVW
jgi:PIN domain nuclease of toxin-antitoxin system